MTTLKQVKSHLRELMVTIRKTPYEQEYRVNYINGQESTAYYTNDLEDAYNTGIRMSIWRQHTPKWNLPEYL